LLNIIKSNSQTIDYLNKLKSLYLLETNFIKLNNQLTKAELERPAIITCLFKKLTLKDKLEKLISYTNPLTGNKIPLKYNKLYYETNNMELKLHKNVFTMNKNVNVLYASYVSNNWYKSYNRHFFTVQQQPTST
jgi:hypothetical protein